MARVHGDFLAAGVRIFPISIDSPGQHAAMIEKLSLPFPILSDPDRSRAITPFGVADPKDQRNLARPAMVLVGPGPEERWRFVSRDFADRLPEEDALGQARALGLTAVAQDPPTPGNPAPGPRAMPFDQLLTYFRGARFAALAMGLRHGYLDESIKDDSKSYVAEMDRFAEAVKELKQRRGLSPPEGGSSSS